MESMMKTIVYLCVALLLAAYILPVGLEAIYGTDTTAFAWSGVSDSATVNLFKLIPLFAVIAVVIMLIFVALKEV